MHNDELHELISRFRCAQEQGLAYTHQRLGLPVPHSNREWMRYGYALSAKAASVAESDGVIINIHGAGIEIVHPDFEVDYDYGPNGDCDCFDAWRLALHRHRMHGLAGPVLGQLELQALLEDAAAAGRVVPLSGSPYFVHPNFRSKWTSRQSDEHKAW